MGLSDLIILLSPVADSLNCYWNCTTHLAIHIYTLF
jgi:hypothetical protein